MLPITDRDLRRTTTPFVVYALVALNVAIAFITLFMLSGLDELIAVYQYGAIPGELSGGQEITSINVGGDVGRVDVTSPVPTWATIFTSMFLHGSILHIAGNMLFLWVFGDNIEDRIGHLGYILFYLACGVVAVFSQVYFNPESDVPMIGASGAVAGVLGAYLVLHPRSRIDTLVIALFIFHVRLPAIVLLGGWILIQVASGLLDAGGEAGGGVAYFAHIGGFVAGAVGILVLKIAGMLRNEPGSRRRR